MIKKIKFSDLILMNISALFGIRWIAKSTAENFGLGLGSIIMWALFSFLFFIPASLICAELAATYKKGGSMYEWVKHAYGDKWGFMISWLNWTSKLFWFSSFLTFLSINVSYMIGIPELSSNKIFVLILSLSVFWILSFVSTKGMVFGKIFTSTGALGSTIPAILLIAMAFLSVVILKAAPCESVYTIESLTPKLNASSLVSISAIIFALSGAEVTANYINEIENPEKNFPRAMFLVAIIISAIYILGSVAITMIMPTSEITASTGILDALAKVSNDLGLGSWFIKLVAAGITLSVVGALVLYISSPVKMLFGNVVDGVFPKSLTKVNEHNIPTNAIYLQTSIVSLLLIGTSLLPTVDNIYNILITMTALTSLFPYIILFVSYIKLRKENPMMKRTYSISKNNNVAIGIARLVLIVTTFGVFMSAAPVMDTLKDNIIYEIQMIGGAILVIGSGLLIWSKYEKRNKLN